MAKRYDKQIPPQEVDDEWAEAEEAKQKAAGKVAEREAQAAAAAAAAMAPAAIPPTPPVVGQFSPGLFQQKAQTDFSTFKAAANRFLPDDVVREYEAKEDVDKKMGALKKGYQSLFDERKKSLEKQQTDDYRMASFNALGNALRTMVQPLGWAAGGSTAGVQQADNRQYLESFNRAVKAGEDIRNLDNEKAKFQLDLDTHALEQAEARLKALETNKLQSDIITQRYNAMMERDKYKFDRQLEYQKAKALMQFTYQGKLLDAKTEAALYTAAERAYLREVSQLRLMKEAGMDVEIEDFPTYLKNYGVKLGYGVSTGQGKEGTGDNENAPWATK